MEINWKLMRRREVQNIFFGIIDMASVLRIYYSGGGGQERD